MRQQAAAGASGRLDYSNSVCPRQSEAPCCQPVLKGCLINHRQMAPAAAAAAAAKEAPEAGLVICWCEGRLTKLGNLFYVVQLACKPSPSRLVAELAVLTCAAC